MVLSGTGDKVYKVRFRNESGIVNTYTSRFEGVINTLNRRFLESTNFDDNKILDYVTEIDCPTCDGKRLKAESLTVFINGKDIGDLTDYNVRDAAKFFSSLRLV